MQSDSSKRHYWTKAEDDLLRTRFPQEPTVHLLPALPGRTVGSAKTRAQRLGLRKTRGYQLAYLTENRHHALAVNLGRPAHNRKAPVTKACEVCGTLVARPPSQAKGFRFCSRDCNSEAMRRRTGPEHPLYNQVERVCEWCDEQFFVKPAKVKMGEGRFCSRSCVGSWTTHNMPRVSEVESRFGRALEECNLKPEAQVKLGGWVVDFILEDYRIAVEFDGTYWHSLPKVAARDKRKTATLKGLGYRVIRIPEKMFVEYPLAAVHMVLDAILLNEHDHRESYPGDGGIRFEPTEANR